MSYEKEMERRKQEMREIQKISIELAARAIYSELVKRFSPEEMGKT